MADVIHILRVKFGPGHDLVPHGKFFTSPYAALAKAAMLLAESPLQDDMDVALDTFGIDANDYPCAHIAAAHFVRGFVNHVHSGNSYHGFIMLEEFPSVYTVTKNGRHVGRFLVTLVHETISPDGETYPVLTRLGTKYSEEDARALREIFDRFWHSF